MSIFFIFFLTSILLGICAFTVLLILMQRPSEESGMGATLGGGAATSVFGGEAVNVLAKITKYCVIFFFTLSFILSMLHLALEKTVKSQHLLEKREVAQASEAMAASDEASVPMLSAGDSVVPHNVDEGVIVQNTTTAPAQHETRVSESVAVAASAEAPAPM
ncbi:MAG: preprotein translocase subunit SecG, partial [Puniceicoccales bacterium]|nr:preprotein translocase subunit SecG [Puniceicoccales bacterium]